MRSYGAERRRETLQRQWVPFGVLAVRATRRSVGAIWTYVNQDNSVSNLPLLEGVPCRCAVVALAKFITKACVVLSKRLERVLKFYKLRDVLRGLGACPEVIESALGHLHGLRDCQAICQRIHLRLPPLKPLSPESPTCTTYPSYRGGSNERNVPGTATCATLASGSRE